MNHYQIEFNEKVQQLLKLHTHIKKDDWENICFALFLKYQDLQTTIEFLEEKIRGM